jgi:hypothetical protein
MINDNVLADRLNAFRSGAPLPKNETITETEEDLEQFDIVSKKISHITKIGYELINLSFVVLQSTAYGFAVKTIFVTDWKFIAVLAVGFTIQSITTKIFNLFN